MLPEESLHVLELGEPRPRNHQCGGASRNAEPDSIGKRHAARQAQRDCTNHGIAGTDREVK